MNRATRLPPDQPLLTPAQAAQRLHVSPVTIRHWALQGRLPCITTPGGHRRFHAEDIERLATEHPDVPAVARPLRVLIVADDPLQARYLVAFLHACRSDAQALLAGDGFEAAVQMQEHQPDLVLLDLAVPGMDGATVCRHIRRHPQLHGTRVIAMTGNPDPELAADIRSAGADGCLAKPLDPHALRTLIQQARPLQSRGRIPSKQRPRT